jgi:hypothetical protein
VLAGAGAATKPRRPKVQPLRDPVFGWPLDDPPPAPPEPPFDAPGGTAVREPRRPKPRPPLAGAVALEPPPPDEPVTAIARETG